MRAVGRDANASVSQPCLSAPLPVHPAPHPCPGVRLTTEHIGLLRAPTLREQPRRSHFSCPSDHHHHAAVHGESAPPLREEL